MPNYALTKFFAKVHYFDTTSELLEFNLSKYVPGELITKTIIDDLTYRPTSIPTPYNNIPQQSSINSNVTTANINSLPTNNNEYNMQTNDDDAELKSCKSNSTNFLTKEEFSESMDQMKNHIVNEILKSIKADKNKKEKVESELNGIINGNQNCNFENKDQGLNINEGIEKMSKEINAMKIQCDQVKENNNNQNLKNESGNEVVQSRNMKVFCNCGKELTCKFEKEQGLCEDCCVK